MKYFDFYCSLSLVDDLLEASHKSILSMDSKDILPLTNISRLLKSDETRISTNDKWADFNFLAEKYFNTNGADLFIFKLLRKYNESLGFEFEVKPLDFDSNNYLRPFSFKYPLEKAMNFSSPLNIIEWNPYSQRYSMVVTKNEGTSTENKFSSWSDVKELRHPASDFVIVDNYMCSYYNLNNIFSIITEMLYKKDENSELNLTILTMKFYYKDNRVPENKKEEQSITKVYNRIDTFIKVDLNLKNVNLTLVKTESNDNHDRHLISNYYVFKAGNSFNFVDSKTGKIRLNSLTDFEIIPLTSFNNEETYAEYYSKNHFKELKKIIDNIDKKNCVGNKKNRLLGIY